MQLVAATQINNLDTVHILFVLSSFQGLIIFIEQIMYQY